MVHYKTINLYLISFAARDFDAEADKTREYY